MVYLAWNNRFPLLADNCARDGDRVHTLSAKLKRRERPLACNCMRAYFGIF